MKKALVVTVVGADRPGIVETLARMVAEHHGNWEASRMARLAGQFAGIAQVSVDDQHIQALAEALGRLDADGLRVHTERGQTSNDAIATPALSNRASDQESRRLSLSLVGADHPGIVRRIAQALADQQVNVVELETSLREAPMAGGLLFQMQAQILCPATVSNQQLREQLESLADSLMIDFELDE